MSKLPAIIQHVQSAQTINLMTRALGYSDVNSETAIAEAKRYASSVLTTIEADPKLQDLDPRSIVLTMIDAAKFRLELDGRKLAYIVPYGGKATMQISYKGFIAKLKEHHADMDYTAGMVYEGDVFTMSDKDGFQDYSHVPKDPFRQDDKGLKGVFVCLKWSESGQKRQKVTIVPKADLDKMQKKSRGTLWTEWYSQGAIKSAIKRAAKIHFASVSTLADMSNYDNKNFIAPAQEQDAGGAGSIVENLNNALTRPQTIEGRAETVDEETGEVTEEEPQPEAEIIPPKAKTAAAKSTIVKKPLPPAFDDEGFPIDDGHGDPE